MSFSSLILTLLKLINKKHKNKLTFCFLT
ncbi:hypothetical protein [Bacillus toyonensis]